MTTLQVRPPYSDAELQQLYPPRLELQLVQILLRHGERTPVNARFQNAGLRGFWPYCKAVSQLRAAILDGDTKSYTSLAWKRRLETFGPSDAPQIATGPGGELDDVCDMGSLTDKGRETTFDLGRRLRSLYVDKLKFLPPSIANADSMYLRSTPVPRALESLHQAFSGLYPPYTRGPEFPPPTVLTRAPQDETLFPNDSNCRRFAALSRAFAQRTADRWNNTDEMAYLNKLLGKWMPPESPRVAVDAHPRLSGVMDTINATRAHGPATKLPSEFYDPKALAIIERIATEEWYSGYRESREYRSLGIGSLMGDVVARMVGSVERSTADGDYELMREDGQNRTPIRFGMSGCHDTTLAGVLASLGALPDAHWPPFTSHIALELFRGKDMPPTVEETENTATIAATKATSSVSWITSWFKPGTSPGTPPPGIGRKPTEELSASEKRNLDGYYVRLRYNDTPMTIPGCKAAGKHLEGDESFCTLEAFKSIVDKYTPRNWKEQCHMNVTAPAFPEKAEPAGY